MSGEAFVSAYVRGNHLKLNLRGAVTHADAVIAGGNPSVVLVEAGLRTFETTTHRTLDLSAVPAVHARSHLPILVDPSRGTGVARKVAAMARAAVAAGADGLVVDLAEPEAMAELMRGVRAVAAAVGRRA